MTASWGGITITPERERVLAWSVPYITTTLSFVVNGAKTLRSAVLRT
jgi:ABC-type amino acid transport substrate-binding protein